MGERGQAITLIVAASSLIVPLSAFAADAPTRLRASAVSRLPPSVLERVVVAPVAETPKISLPPDIVRNFRVTDYTGATLNLETAGDGSAHVADAGARDIALVPKTRPTTSARLGTERLMLPVVYLNFRNSSGQPVTTPVEGGVFLQAARSPMVWDAASGDYSTDVFVGYDFGDGRPAAIDRTVLLIVQGTGTNASPDRVKLSRSGNDGAQTVSLHTKTREGDVTIIARETADNEQPVSIPVLAEFGGIGVTVSPSRIEAFGLGTGTITVRLLARDGRELPAALAPRATTLTIDAPLLSAPTSETIEAGQTHANVAFRTRGAGSGVVRVESGGFTGQGNFSSALPLLSLTAVAIGSLLGGVARWYRNRGAKKNLQRQLMKALVVGVIFVAAVWAGLVWKEIDSVLTTPLGGFVLAALAAYTGMVVLDRVAGKVMPADADPKKDD